MAQCNDCGSEISIAGCIVNEIVTCQTCGIDYIIEKSFTLKELTIDGEDFGE